MSTFFSVTLLGIGAVLLWRSEWATNRRAQKRSKPQKEYADFWIAWNAPESGTSSQGRPIMDDDDICAVVVEYCDRCCQRATYLAFKDDLVLAFCDHHTHEQVDGLVAKQFHLHIIPGVRAAAV